MEITDTRYRYQLFKGSSPILTRDTPLWRYSTFEKFCWLIETSQLYHARLDQFQDPFEGCVTNEYARQRAVETEPSQVVINQHEPWINISLLYRTYAACWHASLHESDAQWKIYAGGGAGIAIVSTMSRLEKAVNLSPHPQGLLGEVEYIDMETHDMRRRPFGTRIRPGFAKRKSFEHEKEVRAVILSNFIKDGSAITLDGKYLEKLRTEKPLGIAAKTDLSQLIQSIVIGPLAAPFVEELVHMITKRHGLEHLVRKSDLRHDPVY